MNAFSRTLRSLATDSSRRWTSSVAVGVTLLIAWAIWFLLGSIPSYLISGSARLETAGAVHPISAVVDGRIIVTRLAVGQEVQGGQVVAELDAVPEQAAILESNARRSLLAARIAALQNSLGMERAGLDAHRQSARIAVKAARARGREASVLARLADSVLKRLEIARAAGAVADADLDRAYADAAARRASAEALALSAERADAEATVQMNDRRIRIADFERRITDAQGELVIETERATQLRHRGELRRVRAPVSGRIGESANLTVGSVVKAGDSIGSVVPSGALRVVALFPSTALGRVRAGQPARIRLDGFPWPAYSRLHGRVSLVAHEPRAGRVRVELTMDDAPSGGIALEHGLPGVIEVEVERASPFELVLRAAGKRVIARSGDAPAGSAGS